MLKKLLEKLPDNLKKNFVYKTYEKDDMIINPGETNEYLYILVSGEAIVNRMNYEGAIVSLKRFDPYSTFGEVEIFDENQKTHGVIASKDCQVIRIHKTNLFECMQYDFELTKFLFKELAEKLVFASDKNVSLSLLSVKDRLLNMVRLHDLMGDLDQLTKEVLVTEIQTPRRSLNRAIVRCVNDGFISYDDGLFKIINRDKLNEHLDQLLA